MAAYGDTVVGDRARIHQGDIYNITLQNENGNDYSEKEQRKQARQYKVLLKSLAFKHMEERQRNVEAALSRTCEWVFDHEKFRSWIDHTKQSEHNGFLWLKGKPGSGKSTIMNELFEWISRKLPEQRILSYFFNARATDALEKSPQGLYRSLLHQLMSSTADLESYFLARFGSKLMWQDEVEEWSSVEIQNFFTDLARNDRLSQITIVIDALDEGCDDDVRQMIAFFEDLAERTTNLALEFRVCFSSRHYPRISIELGLSLVIEDERGHTADIEAYVLKKLSGRRNERLHEIQRMILQKSAGVFLWVVLVVKRLNGIYAQGKGIMAMENELRTVPADLEDLFANILRKDEDRSDICMILLQWVLCTLEPLTPRLLYMAIQSSLDSSTDMNSEELEEELEKDQLLLFLLNHSRGLVEVPSGGFHVQFIHETVREFLLKAKVPLTSYSAPSTGIVQASELLLDHELCHKNIAITCLKYLLKFFNSMESPNDLVLPGSFTNHVVYNWWRHIGASGQVCCQQLLTHAMELLTCSRRVLWRLVQSYDPDVGHRRGIVRGDLASPIYYAVSFNLLNLIPILIAHGYDVNAQGGLYGTPLQLAAKHGNKAAVQILLKNGADINARGGCYDAALIAASHEGHKGMVKILLENGANINAQSKHKLSALRAAIDNGHHEIAKTLKERGAV